MFTRVTFLLLYSDARRLTILGRDALEKISPLKANGHALVQVGLVGEPGRGHDVDLTVLRDEGGLVVAVDNGCDEHFVGGERVTLAESE